MLDREKVINNLEIISVSCKNMKNIKAYDEIDREMYSDWEEIIENALTMLKEQEVRELTMDEWREWKANEKRDPICELWEYETTPMWILNPNKVHEPAFLMGKLKLFTGKPTFEQCKAVKWE